MNFWQAFKEAVIETLTDSKVWQVIFYLWFFQLWFAIFMERSLELICTYALFTVATCTIWATLKHK